MARREIPESMRSDKFKNACMEGMAASAMQAALRDYMKEVEADNVQPAAAEDVEDLFDGEDAELEALHRQRLAKMRKEAEKHQELRSKGHGSYREIDESEFLKEVTASKFVVVHFYHPEFSRCKIVDKHLLPIAQKYVGAKFLKMNAEKAPFFIGKLQIRTLPAVLMFIEGVCKDRIIGFEDFGNKDDFAQEKMERRLENGGVLKFRARMEDDSDEEDEEREVRMRNNGTIRSGKEYGSDEDF